jgi:type II secretory pathway component GspD/PulD (secretin)
LLVGMLLLAACNRGGEGEIRTIPLTYLSSEDALKLVTPYLSEEIAVSASQAGSPAIALRGPDARVNQLADLIGRFDRPVPNVQLRFQVIEANGFTSSDTAIADVEAVLRDLFRFRGYRLVAESLVRSEAPGNAMQRLVGEDGTPFEIRAQLTRLLQQDTARAVTLEVQLDAYGTAVLGTTLTVPSGQTVVVGTARSGREGNTLILVVRPRIE